MPAGLSAGVTTTSLFVAKSVRPSTPGSSSTASIAVPLADAKTSAVPSLAICSARSVDEPKLKRDGDALVFGLERRRRSR